MKMDYLYILDGHKPILEKNPIKWLWWMIKADRIMANTRIGELCVLTFFKGMPVQSSGSHPLLFTTEIFNEDLNAITTELYHTWDDAIQGHAELVKKTKN